MHHLVHKLNLFMRGLCGEKGFAHLSWSQEGEDLVLARLLEGVEQGFYVDIGAHHPLRFSNTYLFYRRGWCGINVDAMPGAMHPFRQLRPRDINLELGVAAQAGSLEFFIFDDPALNTFDAALAARREQETPYRVIGKRQVACQPLVQVLDEHMPTEVAEIAFMSIDVEGLDVEVLKTNDWRRYRPRVVVVEMLESTVRQLFLTEAVSFMETMDYQFFGKTCNSVFFLRTQCEVGR